MNGDLKRVLAARIRHLDIPIFGIADADRWEGSQMTVGMPRDFHPRSIFPECRSVIVFGYPIILPVIETTPSIQYHEMYRTVNSLLDQATYRVSLFLNQQGHASVPVTRDGYGSLDVLKERPIAFFSHKHAAYLAGLGTFGVNNNLLTEEFGPRVRFASILTTAELPSDPVKEMELCIRCMRCVRKCPVQALQPKDYPKALTDKSRCTGYHESLYKRHVSPCGICIKVCPVGEDRKLYGRTDLSIYEDESEPSEIHKAWDHVRSYGGKV